VVERRMSSRRETGCAREGRGNRCPRRVRIAGGMNVHPPPSGIIANQLPMHSQSPAEAKRGGGHCKCPRQAEDGPPTGPLGKRGTTGGGAGKLPDPPQYPH